MSAPLGPGLLKSLDSFQSCLSNIDEKVMDKISDTVNSQGVMALFKIKDFPFPVNCTFVVICDTLRDPGNVGNIIRTAYGFGADVIVCVDTCDPWVRIYNDIPSRLLSNAITTSQSSHQK